jgi:hypothetical protein
MNNSSKRLHIYERRGKVGDNDNRMRGGGVDTRTHDMLGRDG